MAGTTFGDLYRSIVAWCSLLFGILSMAAYTPSHGKISFQLNFIHGFDFAMTLAAVEAFGDVRLMIEFGMIGEIMNFQPTNWLTVFVAFSQELDILAVRSHILMTFHTCSRVWHGSMLRSFHIHMAVLTVNVQFTCMYLMAEWNRLIGGIPDIFCGGADQIADAAEDENKEEEFEPVFLDDS